jgi:hypothetical protein
MERPFAALGTFRFAASFTDVAYKCFGFSDLVDPGQRW